MHWTVHLDGGPRRVNHAACLIGDKIYSFGGYCSGDDFEIRRPIDIHVLDIVTLRWKLLQPASNAAAQLCEESPNIPYHRYGHTVVAYEGKAYLFGGRNDCDGACNKLFEYDPETASWTLVTPASFMPPVRDGHTSCVVNDAMIVFGGFEEEFHRFSNEVYAFDFRTKKWSQYETSGMRVLWRDFHTATALNGKMYVFGGRSDLLGQYHSNHEVYDPTLYYLDLRTLVWHEVVTTGSPPIGRRSHSAFVHDGYIYVFGGYNGQEDRHYSSLHRFDPESLCWTELHGRGVGPKPRRRQCCVVSKDRMFLFGGTSPKETHEYSTDDEGWESEPDLTDHADLFILDFAPTLKTLSIMALVRYVRVGGLNRVLEEIPFDLRWDVLAMTRNNKIVNQLTRSENSSG